MNVLAGALLTLLAVALWGVLHSLLAGPRAKRWLHQHIGSPADRGYRLIYNAIAVVTLLPVLAVTASNPGLTLYQIPAPWVYLTTAIQILAIVAIVLTVLKTGASSFLGVRQLFGSQGSTAARLQVSGFYRWIRHPLYAAGLIFIWLSPVMTTSTLALYLGFTLYIVIGSQFEERQLADEFGEPYLEYRQKVPALIPQPWRRY
ncbi:MAG: isoprenylcysteine carboxylmethyltransferase family protein [Anaerolineales bacterium]